MLPGHRLTCLAEMRDKGNSTFLAWDQSLCFEKTSHKPGKAHSVTELLDAHVDARYGWMARLEETSTIKPSMIIGSETLDSTKN